MPRIKITGYINSEDLPERYLDLEGPAGPLSEEGFQAVLTHDGPAYDVATLEDVEATLED